MIKLKKKSVGYPNGCGFASYEKIPEPLKRLMRNSNNSQSQNKAASTEVLNMAIAAAVEKKMAAANNNNSGASYSGVNGR